jgi:hypothetical protein
MRAGGRAGPCCAALFDGSSPRREAGIQARVRLVFCLGPGLRRGDELTPAVPAIYSGQGDELVPSMLAIYPGQTGPAPLRRALIRRIVIPARGRDPGARPRCLMPGPRPAPGRRTYSAVPAILRTVWACAGRRTHSKRAGDLSRTDWACASATSAHPKDRHPGARPGSRRASACLLSGPRPPAPGRQFTSYFDYAGGLFGETGPAPGDGLVRIRPHNPEVSRLLRDIYRGSSCMCARALVSGL